MNQPKIENASQAMRELLAAAAGGGAREVLVQKMAEIESRITWVACPWCGEEWMRLYHGLCVDCNRDARGFLKAQARMPIVGADIKIEMKPWAYQIPKEDRTPECFAAMIRVSLRNFYAEVNTTRTLPIYLYSEIKSENAAETDSDDGTNRPRLLNYHDSVFSAWKALKRFLDPHGFDRDADEEPPF